MLESDLQAVDDFDANFLSSKIYITYVAASRIGGFGARSGCKELSPTELCGVVHPELSFRRTT
jgi:hypothetical protein